MNVLVFTSLFPNAVEPNHGIFIKQRVQQAMNRHGWKMNVVAPVPFYPPGLGGWRVKYRKIPEYEHCGKVKGWHPRYVMIPKVGMWLQGFLLFLSVWYRVWALKRQFPFVLIDAHYVYPDGFAAILLSWAMGVPVVVSARGSDVNLFKTIPVIRQVITWTLKKANAVVVVSKALKYAVMDLGIPSEKIRVIPNGVDPKKFFAVPQNEAKTKIGFLNHGHKLLVSVCHLTANKGIHVLLEGLALLQQKSPSLSWNLVILGDGGERAHLEQLTQTLGLEGQVKFLGAVSHDELVWFYNAADLCCLLSEREGWPNVVVEALSCGTPVLATRVGGIPEILTSSHVGIMVDREPRAVANGLKSGLECTWSKTDIMAHAKQFRWSDTADALKEVFQSVLSMSGAQGGLPSPSRFVL